MLQAGDLDRRVTFQQRTGTQSVGTGAYKYTWADLATIPTVWAKVIEETRPEKIEAGIGLSNRPCVIFIRYRADITPDMRVIYGSRTMKIVAGPAEIGRREWLRIVTEELSTTGDEP